MTGTESRTIGEGSVSLLLKSMSQAPFAALLFAPDDDLTLLWRNDAHEVMSDSVGRSVAHIPMFEAFPPAAEMEGAAAKEAIEGSVKRILASGYAETIGPYRYDLRSESGEFVEHHWEMRMSPVRDEDGQIEAILQVAEDVTERVLVGQLDASLKRAAHSTTAVSYFSFEPNSGEFVRSADIDAMFGYAAEEAGHLAEPFLSRIHPDDLPAVQDEVGRIFAAPKGELASLDYRVVWPDGTLRYLRVRGEVVTDPDDRRDKMVGTFVDLSDIEENRRALAEALELSEALVAEANHRIKNSLAIAVSMIRSEQRAFADRDRVDANEANDILSSVAARIHAVSDAHGLMQLSKERTSVSFRSLCDRLVASARQTAGLSEDQLTCTFADRDAVLDSERGVTLALILNELVSNALKYGLRSDGVSEIDILFNVVPDAIVVDLKNRKALDQSAVNVPSTNLGSKLVQQLSAKLQAVIEVDDTSEAYRVRLSIPMLRGIRVA